jgi:hypothetical protein
MASMDCPNCGGSGYTQDAASEDVVGPMCDGIGVLLDEDDTDAV